MIKCKYVVKMGNKITVVLPYVKNKVLYVERLGDSLPSIAIVRINKNGKKKFKGFI